MKLRTRLLVAVLLTMVLFVPVCSAIDSTVVHIENHFDSAKYAKWPYLSGWGVTVSYEDGVAKCVSNAVGSVWNQQLYIHDANDKIPVEKDKNYIITMRVKAGENFKSLQMVHCGSAKSINNISEEWSNVEIPFTAVANGDVYFVLGSTDNSSLAATVYIDDFYLYEPAETKIISSTPADGEIVMPSNEIELNFNAEMDETTLKNLENYEINGDLEVSQVQVSEDLKKCILILSDNMAENTSYTLTVSNLKDFLGQEVAAQVIAFETGEFDAPAVESSTPADGEKNVPLNTNMLVLFDSTMDEGTITVDNVLVNGSRDNLESVTIDQGNPKKIIIRFKNLEYKTNYIIKLFGMKNEKGKSIADTEISFVTKDKALESTVIHMENHFNAEKDTKWPYISGWGVTVSYEDGVAKCVSKTVGNIWNQQLYIHDANDKVPVEKGKDYLISMRVKAGDNFNTLQMVNGGSAKTVSDITTEWKTVLIPFTANANGDVHFVLGSADNNTLAATVYIDDFILCEPADLILKSSAPANCEKVLPTSKIELTFNNAMNIESLKNISNYELDGGLEIAEIQVSGDSKTCILVLKEQMQENSIYTLTVSKLKDLIGQELKLQVISFETSEFGIPVVESSTPSEWDVNVSLDADMLVVFDSIMDVSTLIVDNVLVNGSKDNVDAILIDQDNPRKILISFKNLEHMTCYTVELSGMKNERGKSIADTEISFVTCAQAEVIYENKISTASDVTWPNISGGGNAITLKMDTDNYYSAPAALKFTSTQATQQLHLADDSAGYKLIIDEYYTISFRVKATENTVASMVLVNGDNKSYLISGITASDEWTEYSKTFKANTTALPFFRIIAESNEMLIDDIKITKVADTELVPLGNFPKQCETEVPVDSEFTMIFGNDIDSNSVIIKLNGESVNLISANGNKITFEPTTTLEYDKVYKVQASVKDELGRDIQIEREFRTTAVFETSGVKFYGSDENITDSTLRSGKVKAVIDTLTNNTDRATVACLVLALYKNGAMVKAEAKEIPVGAQSHILTPAEIDIDVPEDLSDGEYILRAFIWKNFEEIIPLAEKKEIKE